MRYSQSGLWAHSIKKKANWIHLFSSKETCDSDPPCNLFTSKPLQSACLVCFFCTEEQHQLDLCDVWMLIFLIQVKEYTPLWCGLVWRKVNMKNNLSVFHRYVIISREEQDTWQILQCLRSPKVGHNSATEDSNINWGQSPEPHTPLNTIFLPRQSRNEA